MNGTSSTHEQFADMLISADVKWEITPIRLGSRTAIRSWFHYLDDAGDPIQIVYRVWLLRSGTHVILVDTGPPMEEAERRGIQDMMPVDEALRAASVEPSDIKHILLTHLHWDHASSADLFPCAQFYAQRAEIEFFQGPAWCHSATARFFSHRQMLDSLIVNGRVTALEGDIQLCPGIRLFKVGGHTPGSQIIEVNSIDGCAILAGDAVPMNRNYIDAIPTGILVNLLDVINARKLIRSLEADWVYTGHDPADRLACEKE